jgi:hypothetical protein
MPYTDKFVEIKFIDEGTQNLEFLNKFGHHIGVILWFNLVICELGALLKHINSPDQNENLLGDFSFLMILNCQFLCLFQHF